VAKACTSPFDENNGTLGYKVMDITIQIFYHDRNWNYWKHYGDPIYDAYSDVSIEEIVDFEVYGKPNIEEINSENLHDIFQPHVPIYDADFGQPREDIYVDCFFHVLPSLKRTCCSIFNHVI
jgi:hypothetical protein